MVNGEVNDNETVGIGLTTSFMQSCSKIINLGRIINYFSQSTFVNQNS